MQLGGTGPSLSLPRQRCRRRTSSPCGRSLKTFLQGRRLDQRDSASVHRPDAARTVSRKMRRRSMERSSLLNSAECAGSPTASTYMGRGSLQVPMSKSVSASPAGRWRHGQACSSHFATVLSGPCNRHQAFDPDHAVTRSATPMCTFRLYLQSRLAVDHSAQLELLCHRNELVRLPCHLGPGA